MNEQLRRGFDHRVQSLTLRGLEFGLKRYNMLEIEMDPNVPEKPPVLILVNHGGLMDTPAMMVTDPYNPKSVPVTKEEFSHKFGWSYFLNIWDAIYAKRDGSDVFAVRAQVRNVLLEQKRGVCIAAEGTRSRSGRLEGLNPHLVRMAIEMATEGIPVLACGIDGYDAMPPGSKFPKPRKISVKVGGPLDLSPWTKKRIARGALYEAGELIRDAIANQLPPERRPLPDTPVLRDFSLKRK